MYYLRKIANFVYTSEGSSRRVLSSTDVWGSSCRQARELVREARYNRKVDIIWIHPDAQISTFQLYLASSRTNSRARWPEIAIKNTRFDSKVLCFDGSRVYLKVSRQKASSLFSKGVSPNIEVSRPKGRIIAFWLIDCCHCFLCVLS